MSYQYMILLLWTGGPINLPLSPVPLALCNTRRTFSLVFLLPIYELLLWILEPHEEIHLALVLTREHPLLFRFVFVIGTIHGRAS